MHSKDLIVDQSRKTQVVKDFRAVSPYIDRTILFETFVVKAIDLSDLSTFVVASNQCDAVRVAHLESKEEEEGFDRVEASIHKVSHEEIVGVRDIGTNLEEFHEVIELSMDVSTDCNWGVDPLNVALLS